MSRYCVQVKRYLVPLGGSDNGGYVNLAQWHATNRALRVLLKRTARPRVNASLRELYPRYTYHREPQQDAKLSTGYPQGQPIPAPELSTTCPLIHKSRVTNNQKWMRAPPSRTLPLHSEITLPSKYSCTIASRPGAPGRPAHEVCLNHETPASFLPEESTRTRTPDSYPSRPKIFQPAQSWRLSPSYLRIRRLRHRLNGRVEQYDVHPAFTKQ
jgi:hypothetical protein